MLKNFKYIYVNLIFPFQVKMKYVFPITYLKNIIVYKAQ
ncbi:mCG1039530 [Mus musculus]|nr:mCG1039530 [Mus musculus]